MESPLYVVRQDSNRIIIPELLKLILLAATMYLGIYMNFLILRKQMTFLHHSLIILVLVILIFVQIKISRIKSRNVQYIFYQNRIEAQGDESGAIFLGNVNAVYLKRNFFDRIFGTGTIYIEPGFVIRAVKNTDQIDPYVQRLVELARQSMAYASPANLK